MLLDCDQAQGWLTTVNLVKHELVMVVLGGCSGPNCDVIHLPAFNLQGEPILRVCVHQLGSVKSKALDNKATIATLPSLSQYRIGLKQYWFINGQRLPGRGGIRAPDQGGAETAL